LAKLIYNRHPIKIPIGEAPIPTNEGENLHIDIYYAQNLTFITCIDAYSKFLVVKEVQNKLNIEIRVMELLQQFPQAKVIMTDNEPSFTSAQFCKSFAQRCDITLHYADPRHSTSNGQVERAHSTLTEIARCIKVEFNLTNYSEIKSNNNQVQSTPEPMEIDESIQYQNRPNNNFNRGNNNRQNYINYYPRNNYNQNQAQKTNISAGQNKPSEPHPPLKRESTGSTNQPAQKNMRVNNIEEDHFLDQNPE